MGDGLGIAAGIAQGLGEGVKSYFSTRNTLAEEAIKKKLANVQSIEAYSKLAPVIGRDKAMGLMQNAGLVDPGFSFQSGALPDPQQSTQPTSSQSPTAPNSLAPSGGTSTLLDSANAGLNQDWGNMDVDQRAMAQFKAKGDWEKAQPAAQAELTSKAWEPLKENVTRIQTVGELHKTLTDALKQGGPKSIPIIENAMGQMATFQNGGKPMSVVELMQENPQVAARYNEFVAKAKRGEYDPEGAELIKQKGDLLAKSARDSYIAAGKGAEARAGNWFQQPQGWSARLPIIDQINSNMGPLHKEQKSKPKGLISGDNNVQAGQPSGDNPFAAEMKARGFMGKSR